MVPGNPSLKTKRWHGLKSFNASAIHRAAQRSFSQTENATTCPFKGNLPQ